MKKPIGLIGCGVVGNTLRHWLVKNTDFNLSCYDPAQDFKDSVEDCEIVFIAVPVPNKSMEQDLSIVRESIERCSRLATIVIRSTIVPGTADMLSKEYGQPVCYMAEFLTERRAQKDFNKQDIYIGLPVKENFNFHNIETSFCKLFEPIKDVTFTTNTTCEMAKFAHNCFGAMKVNYWNCINQLCNKEGVSYNDVKEIAMSTGFINKEHTRVPGNNNELGFSGKCFPENIVAMMGYTRDDNSVALFKTIYLLNKYHRSLNK